MKNIPETDRNIAAFWLFWKEAKKYNIKWGSLTKHFKTSSSLEEVIKKCEFNNPLMLQESFFEAKSTPWESDKEIDKLLTEWEEDGIFAISFFDFYKFNLLKNIKNSYFFFIKGNFELLNSKKTIIAVVGSRKTPRTYISWIEENIPKDKIVVSGMAFGADTFAHLNAINNNQEIVVFPGIDIYKINPSNPHKNKIVKYALENGLLISNIFPDSKTFDKSIFLKRNKWMAQISESTYVPYFKGQSGTLGQLLETAKLNKKIYIPKDVYKTNINFLEERNNFNIIISKLELK